MEMSKETKRYLNFEVSRYALMRIRENASGLELGKLRNLYLTLVEQDSDLADIGDDHRLNTKKIHDKSGIFQVWIPTGIKKLEKIGIIRTYRKRHLGRYAGKYFELIVEK